MAEGGEAEWELCKENIQPLKKGRAISALHQALSQQQEGLTSATNQHKQAFESELRVYDGDDPLDVWDRYVKWTEQTYPQGGKESNLSVLLERAKRHRIPVSVTVIKKVLTFNRFESVVIGCLFTGNSLRLQLQGPPAPANSGLNSRLVIFDENKATSAGPSEPKLESWIAPPPSRSKENEQRPEKWSNEKMPMKSRFGHSVVAPPSKPNFQPFVEESDQPPAMTPWKINPVVNSVLSARKPCRDETPLKRLQQHQQEEGKAQEQSMYCKDLLLSVASEFCFEELRAERYRQKMSLESGGSVKEEQVGSGLPN
ncbi:mitotic checkpoint serine/threonine-protein kinase BUB1 beta-like [Coregonus clupeaformis]|uniref:mitotic checkpoint serine/threonine-protein kinase BUB1 beta-like n=1 Tax=Coregonus clupeaformis TaxID=59861 RepID=UPI001BE1216C|nr:mitotic checkpoint serine/threonine-protein kinase BUB1 beta-like [Coregonus clupeaformis]